MILAVEHANEAGWDETAVTIVRVGNKKRPGHKYHNYGKRQLERNDSHDQM